MGLSSSLALLAVATAVVPIALVGFRPPRGLGDLEKVLVSAVFVAVVGTIVINSIFDLDIFGLAHLAYVLIVVTVPVLTLSWYLLAYRSGYVRRVDTVFGVIGGLIAIVGLYATHVEPNWLRVDHVTIEADVDSKIRIGVLADLQTPNVGAFERRAVDELLDQAPHLVVVPGDLYQGEVDELQASRSRFVLLLRDLTQRVPIVAVTSGDSDHRMDLRPIVEEAGAIFLDDSVHWVEISGEQIRLAGVRVVADGPARGETLAALSEPVDALTVLVAHRPDIVYELADDADIDLVVSGHTHGGQVSIPFFGPPVTFTDVPRHVAAGGLHIVDGVQLYLSSGVGLERLQAPQLRFGVRPSVGVVEFLPPVPAPRETTLPQNDG